ncbi:MAG: phosphoribosylformimino-5-aminoimidazole carboxamide ribotide isomerase, partial [Verrucomicrobiales bacterium]|nr:phosphoribosylformimino-5-aminoimidazole carboxamide ribotide isomerase [Verrucomicrobiales bacterium]
MTCFRPCIDLHEGRVKQIVGGTLTDGGEGPAENFVRERPAAEFAELYRNDGLRGGHVIQLGPGNEAAALGALEAYPGGLQIGGGVSDLNALSFLEAGASHVIVTSWLFPGTEFSEERLDALVGLTGADRVVVDLSCRRVGGGWVVAKDRWQTLTDLAITGERLDGLVGRCDELLIHAADV